MVKDKVTTTNPFGALVSLHGAEDTAVMSWIRVIYVTFVMEIRGTRAQKDEENRVVPDFRLEYRARLFIYKIWSEESNALLPDGSDGELPLVPPQLFQQPDGTTQKPEVPEYFAEAAVPQGMSTHSLDNRPAVAFNIDGVRQARIVPVALKTLREG